MVRRKNRRVKRKMMKATRSLELCNLKMKRGEKGCSVTDLVTLTFTCHEQTSVFCVFADGCRYGTSKLVKPE